MAWRGKFDASYYTPVEVSGLYWHFVDIVWIFLFPLLYLIGRALRRGTLRRHVLAHCSTEAVLLVFVALMVGTALTVARGARRPRRHEQRRDADDRRRQGAAGHPVLHARPLEHAPDVGRRRLGFFWLLIMFSITMTDYLTRGWMAAGCDSCGSRLRAQGSGGSRALEPALQSLEPWAVSP